MILGGASGPPPRPAACLVNIALNWISFADQKNSRQNSHKLSAPKGAVLRPNTAPLGCLGGGVSSRTATFRMRKQNNYVLKNNSIARLNYVLLCCILLET